MSICALAIRERRFFRTFSVGLATGNSESTDLLAPKARSQTTLGHRPRNLDRPKITKRSKPRMISVCSFPIPYAPVTLQTERALNLAPRIEHTPSPQSSPRKRGEAEWCRVSRTYRRKTRVASCLPSPRSTSATRINYFKLNAC